MAQLERALILRGADDTTRTPLRRRKGLYGMGMKTGMLGLGWKVTVVTRSYQNPKEELRFTIDTREVESRRLHLDSLPVEIGSPTRDGALGTWSSGTCVLVEDLHRHDGDPLLVRDLLGRAFGADITFNGTEIRVTDGRTAHPTELPPCEPEAIPVIEETKVQLEPLNLLVSPDPGDGTRGPPVKIGGWLALRVTSSAGRGDWGLHTFRMGQLVEAFHHDGPLLDGLLPFNPHPQFARLHGEVHLDMCEPNFTKVGWNTERASWSDAREKLRPYLEQLMNESKAYRVSTHGAEALQMHQKFIANAKDTVHKLAEGAPGEPGAKPKVAARVESKDTIRLPTGESLRISVVDQPFSPSDLTDRYWRYVYRPDSGELAVFVNTESALWREGLASKDRDRFTRMVANWAILDSLYFCLTSDFQMGPNEALRLRMSWLECVYPDKN